MYKRTRVHIPKPPTPERHIFPLTREEADKEYKECHELEKELHRKYKSVLQVRRRMRYTLPNLQWIADNLCERLGSRKVKVVHLPAGSKECSHYNGQFIVVAHWGLGEYSISTLLHELAHHIVRKEDKMTSWSKECRCHSKDFLWVLEMLWDMWYGEMK
jgi:hypothetical protein